LVFYLLEDIKLGFGTMIEAYSAQFCGRPSISSQYFFTTNTISSSSAGDDGFTMIPWTPSRLIAVWQCDNAT